ncbi:MAG: TVP38/TMEM64 family protein [Rhizobiaceae bacterium]
MPEKTALTGTEETCPEPASRSGYGRFVPIAVIIAGLGFGYAMGWDRYLSFDYLVESRDMLKSMVAAHYLPAVFGFAAVYALATAFSFPAASLLTIFAGFLFGWIVGGAASIVGATVGATAIFIAARTAFGDFLKQKVGGKVARLARGFEKDAFSYLFVLRLAPIFPFFVINIAPALFNVPLRTYILATFLGIIPGGLAYAYLGEGLDSVIVAAAAAGRDVTIRDVVTTEIVIAFAALAIVAAIPTVVKKLRGNKLA